MSMFGVVDHRIECVTDGRTKQSEKDACDVNLIVAKFERTGLVDHLAGGLPSFQDVSEIGDYRSAIENVRKVDEYFQGLPAAVRTRFDNDAASFMEYLESGGDEDDMRELGLEVLGDRRSPALTRRGSDAEPVVVVTPVVETAPVVSDPGAV